MRTRRPPRSNVILLFPEFRPRCQQCGKLLEEEDSGRRKKYCGSICCRRASRARVGEQMRAIALGELVLMPKSAIGENS